MKQDYKDRGGEPRVGTEAKSKQGLFTTCREHVVIHPDSSKGVTEFSSVESWRSDVTGQYPLDRIGSGVVMRFSGGKIISNVSQGRFISINPG